MKKIKFKIFINGSNNKNKKFSQNVHQYLAKEFGNNFEFEEVDVIKHPETAEQYKIIAIPTILDLTQEPPVRFIGDFYNSERLKELLEFYSLNY